MKRSESNNPNWKADAHKLLDLYEANVSGLAPLTWRELEKATGFKRKKLWSNTEIYNRYRTVKIAPSVKRKSKDQRILALQHQIEGLEENLSLLQEKFVVLIEHLEGMGVDPEAVFKSLGLSAL